MLFSFSHRTHRPYLIISLKKFGGWFILLTTVVNHLFHTFHTFITIVLPESTLGYHSFKAWLVQLYKFGLNPENKQKKNHKLIIYFLIEWNPNFSAQWFQMIVRLIIIIMNNLLFFFCPCGNAHSEYAICSRHAINNDSHICTEMHSINEQSIFSLSFVHFNFKEEKQIANHEEKKKISFFSIHL